MELQRSTVSRKTPRDGKLEISIESAMRLERLGGLEVVVGRVRAAGRVASMPCTCRGPGDEHVHWFLESEPLKTLAPGDSVAVAVGEGGAVVVTAG